MEAAQQVRLSSFIKPLADFERSIASVLKTMPPVMMLIAPIQSAYEPLKKDLKAKGYAVPEQVPTGAEIVYYSMLNTELGKMPPIPFASPEFSPEKFGFAGMVSTEGTSASEGREEGQTTKLIRAQIV